MKELYVIKCLVCQDNHTITIKIDNDKNVIFVANSQPFSFWQKLRFWVKIRRERYAFTFGQRRDFFGVILNKEILREIINILENNGYKQEKLTTNILHETVTKNLINLKNETCERIIYEILDLDGIYLQYDNFKELTLSLHLMHDEKIGKLYKGEITRVLSKKKARIFLYYIKELEKILEN